MSEDCHDSNNSQLRARLQRVADWPECVPPGYEFCCSDSDPFRVIDGKSLWACSCLNAQKDGWRWEHQSEIGWILQAHNLQFSADPDYYRIAYGPAEGREVKRGDGVWIVPEGAQFWNAIGAWENVSPNMVGQLSRGVYYKMPEAAPPAAPDDSPPTWRELGIPVDECEDEMQPAAPDASPVCPRGEVWQEAVNRKEKTNHE